MTIAERKRMEHERWRGELARDIAQVLFEQGTPVEVAVDANHTARQIAYSLARGRIYNPSDETWAQAVGHLAKLWTDAERDDDAPLKFDPTRTRRHLKSVPDDPFEGLTE